MHSNYRIVLASLLLLIPLASIAAWEDYKEKSLQDTIDEYIDLPASADQAFTPGQSQLVLTAYTGEKRSIPKDREKMVRAWLGLIGQPVDVGDLFLTEMKFLEDGKEHWLPVQKPLITYFESEMRPGEMVWLYTVWVGATKSEFLFVVNEFKKANP